jgi:hypothetical protein
MEREASGVDMKGVVCAMGAVEVGWTSRQTLIHFHICECLPFIHGDVPGGSDAAT